MTPDEVSPSIQEPSEEENAPLGETGSEMVLSAEEIRAEAPESSNPEPVPQVSSESTLENADPTAAPGMEEDSRQTDLKMTERPNRRRKTAPFSSQSDTEAAGSSPSTSRRRLRRRSPGKTIPVIPIDEGRTVETAADKARNDLLDLVESQKTGRILTGTLQGVERAANSDTKSLAVLYHGAFKVIIPAEEAVVLPDDTRGRSPDEILHYMLTKRLGAEVDYIVKGVDPQSNLAVGSRL